MKTLAIIQARMGSTRLPGKALLKLADKTVIEHVVERVSSSRLVDQTIIATTTNLEDGAVATIGDKCGVSVFRGSSDDVLDRFYQAAKAYKPQHVVRITGDCPLIDPLIIDSVISRHFDCGADYTTNGLVETFPDGQDVEVFRTSVLRKVHQQAKLASQREHVTLYIRNHPELFELQNVRNPVDLSSKRWTLDNPEDYRFVSAIYKGLYRKHQIFHMAEILDYLKKMPQLEQINSHITRNEGLAKSLKEDHKINC